MGFWDGYGPSANGGASIPGPTTTTTNQPTANSGFWGGYQQAAPQDIAKQDAVNANLAQINDIASGKSTLSRADAVGAIIKAQNSGLIKKEDRLKLINYINAKDTASITDKVMAGSSIYDQLQKSYEASPLGKGLNFVGDVGKAFVKAPVIAGNTVTGLVTGKEGNVAGVGGVNQYGSDTLKSFGISKPNDVASTITGTLLTAADMFPLAGMGLTKSLKAGATGLEGTIKPLVAIKDQLPDLTKSLNKTDYNSILKSKIDAVPAPKPGEVTVIQTGDGKYVDTNINTALSRGINKNTKVFNVKEGDISLTDNTTKNLNGERLIQTPDAQATQLSNDLIAAAGAESNKYKKGVIGNFVQGIKKTLNITHDLRTIDMAAARKDGVNVSKMKKTESLEHAYDQVLNYKSASNELLLKPMSSGDSVAKVMQKHGGDVAEFNNYRNAVAEKVARAKGVKFRTALSNSDLNSIIKTYETTNPGARGDIKTLNEALNTARAHARENGAITAELDKKLGNSKYYTPVMAVDEGAPKIKMGGKSVTRGDQQFVKGLTGPADRPLDVSFTAMQNYIEKAYKNSAEAHLSQLILRRHKEGLIKGSKLVSEVGAKDNKAILRNYSKQLNKDAAKLQTKVKITTRQARAISKELNDLNKKGLLKSLKGLEKRTNTKPAPQVGKTVSPKPTLNTSDPIKLIKQLVNSTPGEVLRIQKSIALREPRLATKLNDILNLQDEMAALKSEATGARKASAEIVDEPTTGKAFIRGVDEHGLPYSLELNPNLTSMLRGVDISPSSPMLKALLGIQRVFQTFWTGVGAPIFNFVTTPLYDAAANVNALVDNPAAFAKSFTPDAFATMFKGVFNSDKYQVSLRKAGATPQGGSLMPQNVAKTAESIISRHNFKSRTGFLLKHPKELLHTIDSFSGKVGNMTRTRLSRGYYKDALKKGYSETEALAEAAYAFNNMSPNFQRLNSLARDANAFIPYFTAGLAGNRSMWQPILAHPGRAAAVYGGIVTTFVGATAYNLSSEAGQKFYKQMHESGNDYVLNGNYVIVLPTASYNPDTGEWSGIIKIPIAPEYRYLNQLASGSTEQAVTGNSDLNTVNVASALLNTMTGGTPDSVLQGPQIIRVAEILTNGKPTNNILTPDTLIPSWMADLPKDQQTYPWTSNPAKFFSEVTGRFVSPIQADQIIKQFGSAGRAATGTSLTQQVTGKFGGAFTQTLKSSAYKQTDGYSQLSNKIKKEAGGSLSKASTIASDFNKKVDSVIAQVKASKMSPTTKQDLIDSLTKRKASLKYSDLNKRLNP